MRTFYDGDKKVQFSIVKYIKQFYEYQARCATEQQTRVTKQAIDLQIAEELYMDYETVKKWHNAKTSGNGPGDMASIKKLAEFLGISYKELITEVGTMKENNRSRCFDAAGSGEKELVQQIFEALIEFIYLFAGKDYQALYICEDPYKEMKDYELKLYRLLDSIALCISDDTYAALRKTISEVIAIVDYSGEGQFIPKEWAKINSYLESTEFADLVECSDSDTTFYHFITSHMVEEEEVDKCFHMLFEDVPELLEVADSVQNDSKMNLYKLEKLIENGNCSMTPPNILVVREISNTLIKVMKKRFVIATTTKDER